MLLLLVSVRCTLEAPAEAENAAAYTETLRLGSDDPDAPDHELFSMVAAVAVDEAGTVYAADAQDGGIRVYDAEGRFQQTIGRRGVGPGEFRQVTALHVDRRGRLLVADPTQSRITAFSLDGELLNTYPLPDVQRIAQIADGPDEGFVVVGAGSEHLVHVVDSTFSSIEAQLVPTSAVTATDHKLETVIRPYFAGRVARPEPGVLAYAPGFYTGEIFVYERTGDGSWTRREVYEGPDHHETPVTISALEDAERVDLPLQMQEGQYAAQVHSVSQALYAAGSAQLTHVFLQEGPRGLELTVERFGEDGAQFGATRIDTASALSLEALTMDAKGQLYLSDTQNVPQLHRLTPETKEED